MRIFKWIGKFFNFGVKYRKQEEKYHNESKRNGPVGHLINLTLTSAIPLLALWGAFALPWSDNMWILKVLCILLCFIITTVPSELFIYGIVALRHRLRMRVQNKVEDAALIGITEAASGKEMSEEAKQEIKDKKARGTADKMDLVIGILAIVLSVIVVITFVTMFFTFTVTRIKRLS